MENKKLELIEKIINGTNRISNNLDVDNLYSQGDFDDVLEKAKELKQILLEENGDQTWLFKFPNGNRYEIEMDYNMGVGGGVVLNAFCFKILKDGQIVGQDFDLNKAISMVFDMENKAYEKIENMEICDENTKNA